MFDPDLINVISTVGFPIFVAVWFMARTEKVISANTQAFIDLKEEIMRGKTQ